MHSIEMLCWIRLQVEIPVPYSAFCFIGYYNGCGNTLFVMIQGIVGAFCVRVPVVIFVSGLANANLFQIGLATPMSSVFQIVLCVAFMLYLKMGKKKDRVVR